MSLIASPFPQIASTPQVNAPVIVNEALAALMHQLVYAYAYMTSAGLTFGYYGGRWGGFSVAAGTLTLTASSTNYIVVALATGVISVSTTTTNWLDLINYARAYKIVTGTSAITGTPEDHRGGPNGVQGGGAGGGTAYTDAAIAAEVAARTAAIASAINGLAWKPTPARARTTAALAANTYANGSSGVGATLTGNSNGALAAQDGVTLAANDRLVVANEVAGLKIGIYALTQVGDGSHPYILTRSVDADTAAKLLQATIIVEEGTLYGDSAFTMTTNAPITVGTTALAFGPVGAAVTDATISTSDITTNNVSITKHGFAPKAPNDATKYLDGTGAYSTPAGGGGGSGDDTLNWIGFL